MKKVVFGLVAMLALMGCSKEDSQPEPESCLYCEKWQTVYVYYSWNLDFLEKDSVYEGCGVPGDDNKPIVGSAYFKEYWVYEGIVYFSEIAAMDAASRGTDDLVYKYNTNCFQKTFY